MFWKTFYDMIAVPAMWIGFQIGGMIKPKFREGIDGRRNVFEKLADQLQNSREKDQTIWFHFPSVGEFEQAKPLIEAVYDRAKIVLTYFSPSVHPNVDRYPHRDAAIFLPLDTAENAKKLFDLIQPDQLIFSKFDIWPNLIWEASDRGILISLIAGTLHAKSHILSPIGKHFFRTVHRHISIHCAISELDADRFRQICPTNAKIVVTGDTRFDRVYQRAMAVDPNEKFFGGQSTLKRPIVIAGSTYAEEEKILIEAYQILRRNASPPHLIIVPHEPTVQHIRRLQLLIETRDLSQMRFSDLDDESDLGETDVIVIDAIGFLAKLYKIGDIVFVGGSFHGSIHNIMEPAAMGKAVIFGPTIHNSYEAMLLKDRGGAFLVHNANEMADRLQLLLSGHAKRIEMGKIGKELIEENLGASDRTLACIFGEI